MGMVLSEANILLFFFLLFLILGIVRIRSHTIVYVRMRTHAAASYQSKREFGWDILRFQAYYKTFFDCKQRCKDRRTHVQISVLN